MLLLVAPLLSIERLLIHSQGLSSKARYQHQVMPRGSHNRQQVFENGILMGPVNAAVFQRFRNTDHDGFNAESSVEFK